MNQRFIRTEMMLGSHAMDRLSRCHVAVFGLGGVGSYAVEALARSGVGELTLIDQDTLSVSNINRQLFALESTVGLSKAEAAAKRCFALANQLREGGVSVECDTVGRGLKAQMKYADKLHALYTIVVGDSELETGKAKLKDMTTGEITDVDLDDGLYTVLYNKSLDRQFADVAELLGDM